MRPSLIVSVGSGVGLLLAGSFALGFHAGASRGPVFELAREIGDYVRQTRTLGVDRQMTPYLQPARNEGSGVVRNETGDDALVLLSGMMDGTNEVRLIERDGTVRARWPVSFTELFPDPTYLRNAPTSDYRVDIHGALALPDGSVVFSLEYSGMVKLGRCGETIWTLRHPTHHSVERAEAGGFWVGGRTEYAHRREADFPPYTQDHPELPLQDDLILHVSEDGQILEQHSVMRILYDSGLEPLMTATGQAFDGRRDWFDGELLHLNKIDELTSDLAPAFPDFEAGDLLISIRHSNLIAVIDRDTWRVKWHQVGPYRQQHDPEFSPDGTITVFNNNSYRLSLLGGEQVNPDLPLTSTIEQVNFADGTTETLYGNVDGQRFMSIVRGKQDPLPGGGLLVTEFEAGRAFEVDANGNTVWDYVNRYDADRVAEITEARIYPRNYFTNTDWSCQQ